MAKNRTRKAIKTGTKTIPELRRAFEHMERFIHTKEGRDLQAFRKEWRQTFGKEVSKDAAENYLKFVKPNPVTVQKGGAMTLSPAPLDYDMRPGTGQIHVPPYIASGFGFANQLSFGANAPRENITPILPADMGSNKVQKGGARRRRTIKKQQGGGSLMNSISTAIMRPFTATSPPSTAQTIQHTWKGQEPLPVGGAEYNPRVVV